MSICSRCKTVCVMLSVVALIAATNAVAGDDHPSTRAAGTQATTLFFDDFSGPALDRDKWNVIVTGRTVNNEQQAYVDSTDTLYIAHGEEAQGAENGALVLKAVFKQGFQTSRGRKYDFVSGRIDTRGKFDFTYGTAAARMKLPAGAGLWPAFWALGNGRWPDTGEIDVMENVGQADWTSVALHGPRYFGDTPLIKRYTFPAKTDITGWHVYSVDWSPQTLVFKVDDQIVYTVTHEMVERFGPWAFDNPKHLILNLALGGSYPSKVNHVKQPYPGIPQQTVQAIKDGKAKVLVDWVRVTGIEK